MEYPHTPESETGEFSSSEGLTLALNYLQDPSSVPCPMCGPGTMEVVAYVDATGIREGVVRATGPDGDYTVVLYCHGCRRAAALDLSPDGDTLEDGGFGGSEDRRAA
ncbi:MAG: hypothetical protein P8177_04005 [Gemmatimonadota bacterium]